MSLKHVSEVVPIEGTRVARYGRCRDVAPAARKSCGWNGPRHRHATGICGELERERFIRIQTQVATDLLDGPPAARSR